MKDFFTPELVKTIIFNVILTPVVLVGLLKLFGKGYLDKKLLAERDKNEKEIKELESKFNKEIELYKSYLKYEERFFNDLYESSQDLFKIRSSLLHDFDVRPDGEWEDVCSHISTKFVESEQKLTELLENYYTALPPEIFEGLEKAKFICVEGEKELQTNREYYAAGYDQANELWKILTEMSAKLKSTIDEKRLVKFSSVPQKTKRS